MNSLSPYHKINLIALACCLINHFVSTESQGYPAPSYIKHAPSWIDFPHDRAELVRRLNHWLRVVDRAQRPLRHTETRQRLSRNLRHVNFKTGSYLSTLIKRYNSVPSLNNNEITLPKLLDDLTLFEKFNLSKKLIKSNQLENNKFSEVDVINTNGLNKSRCFEDFTAYIDPITDALVNLILNNSNVFGQHPFVLEALPLYDALGKIPTGILEGNLHWIGQYDQCNSIRFDYNLTKPAWIFGEDEDEIIGVRTFKGKYSRITFEFSPDFGDDTENSTNGSIAIPVDLQFGFCSSVHCSPENIREYFNNNLVLSILFEFIGINIADIYQDQDSSMKTGRPEKAFAAFIVVLVLLAVSVIATVYDTFIRRYWLQRHFNNLSYTVGVFPNNDDQNLENPNAVNLSKRTGRRTSLIIKKEIDAGVYELSENGKDSAPESVFSRTEGGASTDVSHRRFQTQTSRVSLTSGGSSAEIARELKRRQSWDPRQKVPLQYENEAASIPPTIFDRIEVFFLGFSFYSNMRRIFTHNVKPEELTPLNGLRVISLFWAILGYQFLLGIVVTEVHTVGNLFSYVLDYPTRLTFQPILNFQLSGYVFFVISGVLVSYWWLKHLETSTKGETVWMVIKFIIHRWWRLVMPFLTVMTIYLLYPYLVDGPMMPHEIPDAENCLQTWWTNVLMINNYVKTDLPCMSWTWYTPIIFQLHVVSLIILLPLRKYPKIAYFLIALFYFVHIVVLSVEANRVYRIEDITDQATEWWDKIFSKPYCQAGPYLIGMALGIFIFKTKCHVSFMNWPINLIGWILCLATLLACTYGTYSQYQENAVEWSPEALASYEVLSRQFWALAIGWIIFSCLAGWGGVINVILSWKVFVPLSRITYCAFLLHPIFIFRYVYDRICLIYIQEMFMSYLFFGHCILIFFLGLLAALIGHYPFVGLERALYCKTKMAAIRAGRSPHPDDFQDVILAQHRNKVSDVQTNTNTQSINELKQIYDNSVYENEFTINGNKMDPNDLKKRTEKPPAYSSEPYPELTDL